MITKLYKKRDDGNINILEVNSDNYRDRDGFVEALDFFLSEGYYETYQEAVDN